MRQLNALEIGCSVIRGLRPGRDRSLPSGDSSFTCWFYFGLLRWLLDRWPWPAWHVPAVVLATVRMPFDTEARHLSRALLRALGNPRSPWRLFRLRWSLAYYREVKLLLYVVAHRLTKKWARENIRCHGTIPEGGAVLVHPHEAAGNVGILHIATMVEPICGLTLWRSADELADLPKLQQQTYAASRYFVERTYGANLYHIAHAGRKALRFLEQGGYLSTTIDGVLPSAPSSNLFGHAVRLPRGPVWFAQQSGKPLVPFVVAVRRGTFHIWISDPIAPTLEARARALEKCVRREPGCWDRAVIHMWLASPTYNDTDTTVHRWTR